MWINDKRENISDNIEAVFLSVFLLDFSFFKLYLWTNFKKIKIIASFSSIEWSLELCNQSAYIINRRFTSNTFCLFFIVTIFPPVQILNKCKSKLISPYPQHHFVCENMKESQSGKKKKYSLAYKYKIRLCKTHIFTDFGERVAKQFIIEKRTVMMTGNEYRIVY